MIPIVRTDYEYESAPPYIVTFEWETGRIKSWTCALLVDAIARFYDPEHPFHPPSFDVPDCRLLVDARGVHIHGVCGTDQDGWALTNEVLRSIAALVPEHLETVEYIEMTTRGFYVVDDMRKLR